MNQTLRRKETTAKQPRNIITITGSNTEIENSLLMPFNYLSANVSSMKVLIADTIFKSPTGDGTAIGHPSHAKVSPLAVQREYVDFSVILRP